MKKDMRRNREQTVQRGGAEERPEVLLRPPSKKWYIQIVEFFWNPENKTCCTRTPLNWLSITIYYAFFLTAVIGIMFLMLYVVTLLAGRDPGRPRYTLSDSPIGSRPGVNFFPSLYLKTPIIWLSKIESNDEYITDIKENLESLLQCVEDESCPSDGGLKNCGIPPFGYDNLNPCVFLRINRLLDWKPVAYGKSDQLPKELPDVIKTFVAESAKEKIWVDCQGTEPLDRDNISNDSLAFQTDRGFDVDRFPYVKQKNYLDSIVAFQINKPLPTGILLSLSCSFWAKNLEEQLDILLYIE